MDEGTVRLSEEKANVGADLWLMKSSLDEVKKVAVVSVIFLERNLLAAFFGEKKQPGSTVKIHFPGGEYFVRSRFKMHPCFMKRVKKKGGGISGRVIQSCSESWLAHFFSEPEISGMNFLLISFSDERYLWHSLYTPSESILLCPTKKDAPFQEIN